MIDAIGANYFANTPSSPNYIDQTINDLGPAITQMQKDLLGLIDQFKQNPNDYQLSAQIQQKQNELATAQYAVTQLLRTNQKTLERVIGNWN